MVGLVVGSCVGPGDCAAVGVVVGLDEDGNTVGSEDGIALGV